MTLDRPQQPPLRGTVDSQRWWQALAEHTLLIWRCPCGETWIYSRSRCPRCGKSEARLEQSSGKGRIVSVSTIHRKHDDAQGARRIIAVIETSEGARLLSQLDCDPAHTPQAVDDVEIVHGREVPRFRIVSGRSGDR